MFQAWHIETSAESHERTPMQWPLLGQLIEPLLVVMDAINFSGVAVPMARSLLLRWTLGDIDVRCQ
ncbi:MAG: hypothetical protein RMM98_07565 [Acidobacteriota bacterium]|nr:hypothetical protein [Blastocatellia bacterium]MDW8239457.1 hypothetical protein [Acidobacteriota bacterium]